MFEASAMNFIRLNMDSLILDLLLKMTGLVNIPFKE
jgi:hypothetical protein